MNLAGGQTERYARQIVLKGVGTAGQKKLLHARVLVIGTGGLGSPAAIFLAAAGIGTIGLVDYDTVDLSNLQRQIIHFTKDVGKPKAISGRETINEINPDVNVETYREKVDAENIRDIIRDKDYDFIIDGTDNFAAKFLINDACVLMEKPFSHGGVLQFQGQTITCAPGKGPCFRCIFESPPPPGAVPTCKQSGVLGVVAGIIGTVQATEAIKWVLGIGDLLTGYLLTYNALGMDFRKIKLQRNKNCPACSKNAVIKDLTGGKTICPE